MMSEPLPSPLVQSLLTAGAVRERCAEIFDFVQSGKSSCFRLDTGQMASIAERVARTTQANYPTLEVPYHSRWRHFTLEGSARDRLAEILSSLSHLSREERLVRLLDLVTISVLLDAGAGATWKYFGPHSRPEPTPIGRSEGLALASFDAFLAGDFSAHPDDALRVDGERLLTVTPEDLARIFQVSPSNPLVGLEGRALLLQRLGSVVTASGSLAGRPGQIGALIAQESVGYQISADAILSAILLHFSDLWPGRISLEGVSLGDTWKHRAIVRSDASTALVPFHKLSQWLTYSTLEPFEWCGFKIVDIERLTGLAEYRNGGLFIDMGVIQPLTSELLRRTWKVNDELVVEWRALTVSLLDRLLPSVQRMLLSSASHGNKLPLRNNFSLAMLLQGGTWTAGREAAREMRPDGSPPVRIDSDGTVF